MSEYQQFLDERDKIDFFIQKGYRINGVKEQLNGDSVGFLSPNGNITETILIKNPNARKYFSSLLIQQNQGTK
ncbi:hypothetical protein [Neobacillus ginsengisoli]|uniref:Uncharacterized protein n=1 Tax=Neobacillus ginsengisoli TaxID=904295 RepID=A0ABT9Y168_9BACI|nr:hypothetical protein [Neobacillus ginsengisoli]MDQ0201388.1 hypothetical protein [Neobacillus ginsengisoli]